MNTASNVNAAIDALADKHAETCKRCARNRPCAVIVRIVGAFWR